MAEEIIENQNQPNETKTFTQEEVNTIVAQRLARERAKGLTEEEIAEYRQMKANQNSDTITALTAERDNARNDLNSVKAELQQMKREKYLTGKGVSDKDIDYYDFKISKMVTDEKTYEQAADEFISEHSANATRVDFGADLSGSNAGKATPNAMMNRIIRGSKN